MGTMAGIEPIEPVKQGWAWWRHLYLALPLAFFALMFLFYPFRERFEFDLDEGGEAMKALLVARGYPLYSQVWSDQPPVLTYIVAAFVRILGPDVDAGRTIILLFSTALMAASALFLRTQWGVWHAVAGALLIFCLPFYTVLSVSLMFGLPAIAFAMLSLLALSVWHQQRRNLWLILSSLALVLSVYTKLFTGFLAPIFVVGILLAGWRRRSKPIAWRSLLSPTIIWSLTFAIPFIVIALFVVGPANVYQLLGTHLEARQLAAYISQTNAQPISWHLRDAWPVLLLAGLGSLFVILERRWVSFYLIAWIAVAYALLSFQVPVWYHHQLLVTVPAALMAAIAAGEGLRLLPQVFRSRAFLSMNALFVLSSLAGFITALVVRIPLALPDFYRPLVFVTQAAHAPWAEQMFLTKMSNHAAETRWAVTDLPMYAFRVGLLVPPYLGFITEKRLATGEVTEEQILQIIEEYHPEQVLMGRRAYPLLTQYLQVNYRLLYERGKRDLYLRKDLKGP